MGNISATQISGITQDEETKRMKASMKVGGFDAGAVRDAVIAGIEASKIPIQERIEITEKRLEAQAEVQLAVGTVLESFKQLQGSSIITSQSGVFGHTKAVLGTHNGEDTSHYFSIMVDSGTKPQNLDVSVLKKAEYDGVKAATAMPTDTTTVLGIIGDLTFANISTALSDGEEKVEAAQIKLDNAVGAPDIATATQELADVTAELDALKIQYPDIVFTFDGTETAANIKSIINAQSTYTGVEASLIPSGDTFILSLDALNLSDPVTFIKNITAGDATRIPEPRNTLTATTSVADSMAALGVIGSLTFNHIDGVSPDIVFNFVGTESLTLIQATIDAQSATTGVTALIVGDPGAEKLVFDAVDAETPPTFTKNITGGDQTLIPDSSIRTKEDLQSRIMVKGEETRHDNNEFKMLGMTFMLFQPTQTDINNPESVSISIEYSPGDVAEKITSLAETANDLLEVIEKYTTTDINALKLTQEEKENLKPALLASNTAIQDIERFMSTAMRQVIEANIGVSKSEGRYTIDAKLLNEAALNKFNDLEKLFVFSETSVNPKFSSTMHPSNIPMDLINNDVTVTLSKDGDGVVTATFDYPGSTGPSEAVNITENTNFFTFKGDAESLYKDFSFFFSGTLNDGESATTTMAFTQGVADLSIGHIESSTKENGIFDKQGETYRTQINSHEDRIERIQSTGSKKIEMLEKKLAAAIRAIQQILSISNQVQSIERMAYAAAA